MTSFAALKDRLLGLALPQLRTACPGDMIIQTLTGEEGGPAALVPAGDVAGMKKWTDGLLRAMPARASVAAVACLWAEPNAPCEALLTGLLSLSPANEQTQVLLRDQAGAYRFRPLGEMR